MTDHNHARHVYTDKSGRGGTLVFVLLGLAALLLLSLLLFSGGGQQGVEIIPGTQDIEQDGAINVPAPATAPIPQ